MPTVRWSLNRVDISQPDFANGRYRLLDQGQGLEIRQASPDDVGIWTCQAENAAGTSTADISLDVWGEKEGKAIDIGWSISFSHLQWNPRFACWSKTPPQ
jgi:hypothetical protein